MHVFYSCIYEELYQCIIYLFTLTNLLMSNLIFYTISEVSISIASSSELRSLLAVADLEGGST